MRDELPGWPGACYDVHEHDGDPHTFGTARSACALLKKGGSWRSYAYESPHDGSIALNGQLLVCQRGKVMMQRATINPQFIVAECELGVNSVHRLEFLNDDSSSEEFLMAELSAHRSLPDFGLMQIKSNIDFETSESEYLTTETGDLELTFESDGYMCSLLLHKESAAEIKAREEKFSKAASRVAKAKEEAEKEKEAKRQARREREAAIKSGEIKKKKRKRRADKW